MEEETYLAIYYDDFNQKIKTSINEVKDWLDNNNKEDLSNFIYHRLHSRYLKPFQYSSCECEDCFKNGFSMLANYCLLIEAIQSFKNGLEDSKGKGKKLFIEFFKEEDKYFPALKNLGDKFYEDVAYYIKEKLYMVGKSQGKKQSLYLTFQLKLSMQQNLENKWKWF